MSASTDRSFSYERLEFLGDRVLGLIVAHMLFAAYPEQSEGELSRRLAALVRKETCAEVAQVWGVGPYIQLGRERRKQVEAISVRSLAMSAKP